MTPPAPRLTDRSTCDEVKGLLFATAKKFFSERYGVATFRALIDRLPPEARAPFEEAIVHAWYPESHVVRFSHLVHAELADGDDHKFLEIMRELALSGIGRFFRVLMNLSSPQFALRKVPVLWARMRRGSAVLESEAVGAGCVRIKYSSFGYVGDRIYRLVSVANCQALVVATSGYVPKFQISDDSADEMTLELQLEG